jgi:hypothetical protein
MADPAGGGLEAWGPVRGELDGPASDTMTEPGGVTCWEEMGQASGVCGRGRCGEGAVCNGPSGMLYSGLPTPNQRARAASGAGLRAG